MLAFSYLLMLRRVCTAAALLWAFAAPWTAAAQPAAAATVPSDAEIARIKELYKKQLEEAVTGDKIEEVRRQNVPDKAATDAAIKANRRGGLKVDGLPVPQNVPNVDIGALAQQFTSQVKNLPKGLLDSQPRLYIFVTLTMPQASLKRLVEQAKRVDATLLLRGFYDSSLQKTSRKIAELVGDQHVAFAIDPEAFDRYGVKQAPSFVLTKAGVPDEPKQRCGTASCEPPDGYALVSGDVSVDYALERIGQRAPAFKAEAQTFLKKIRG